MAAYGGPRQSCPVTEQCSEWIFRYLGDCVCDLRDSVSFALGLASVLSWGVAEIPQILTNFFAGSTEGVSLTFLLTWTFGDFFNLGGCYLEPATLPTQFYMALLYTITTIFLVAQSIWYEVLHPTKHEVKEIDTDSNEQTEVLLEPERIPEVVATPSISVPLSRKSSSKDIYITSARSLASSYTPTMGSFVPGSAGHLGHGGHSLLSQSPGQGQPHIGSHVTRALAVGALVLGGLRMGAQLDWAAQQAGGRSEAFVFGGTSRRLLQISMGRPPMLHEEGGGSIFGQILGWCMAAIYMGGRLPQIWLNIQRGTVEGLSPLMFLFALVGNATYVGSILVRSLEWTALKPNLAWLVDAGVCVCLDLFILCQFVYYSTKKTEEANKEDDYAPLK